ncbi:hypothetical protein U1Q18_012049 [Sarracenia purpurea var. burkii]
MFSSNLSLSPRITLSQSICWSSVAVATTYDERGGESQTAAISACRGLAVNQNRGLSRISNDVPHICHCRLYLSATTTVQGLKGDLRYSLEGD